MVVKIRRIVMMDKCPLVVWSGIILFWGGNNFVFYYRNSDDDGPCWWWCCFRSARVLNDLDAVMDEDDRRIDQFC